MHRFDAITFDCYGTLIDWASGIAAALARAAGDAAVRVAPAKWFEAYLRFERQLENGPYRPYREILAAAAKEAAAELGCPAPPPDCLAADLPRWRPFPDVNPALLRLRRAGYVLGILSNIDDDLLAATQRHFAISFDFAVTAEQVRSYKPALGHFLAAREILRARFGTARWLHVAQSHYHDIAPAQALSIPAVWVNRERAAPPPEAAPPLREVADLSELAAWLAGSSRAPDRSRKRTRAAGRVAVAAKTCARSDEEAEK